MAQVAGSSGIEPRHIVWLLALGGIWGSSYLFIKLLVDAVDPFTMIWVRLVLGALVLGAVQVARGQGLPTRGPIWTHMLVMSLIGNLLPFWLIAWSQRHATSSMAAILNATIPLFTLVIAVLVFRFEHFTGNRLTGIALGLIGTALLTGTSIVDVSSASGRGELALLASCLCYAFAFAYARRYVSGDPTANVTAQLLIGSVIIAPIVFTTGWLHTEKLAATDLLAWAALGALGTGLAYIAYYALIRDIGATAASFVTYLIPVVGVLLGWVVLGERIGLPGFGGMLLIIAGVAISYGWQIRGLRAGCPLGRRGPR